jgi:DNA polymerase I-like protein with 3'-5' exonuclease and polymerase domains
MIKVFNLLKDRKSHIAFSVHDSLVIDFDMEDKDLLSEMVNVFSETDLAKFKVNMSIGKDYGSMRTKRL